MDFIDRLQESPRTDVVTTLSQQAGLVSRPAVMHPCLALVIIKNEEREFKFQASDSTDALEQLLLVTGGRLDLKHGKWAIAHEVNGEERVQGTNEVLRDLATRRLRRMHH